MNSNESFRRIAQAEIISLGTQLREAKRVYELLSHDFDKAVDWYDDIMKTSLKTVLTR